MIGDYTREWTGPVKLDLTVFSEHSRTVRYRCRFEKKYFDYYIPIEVLKNKSKDITPASITVVIMKTDLPKHELGFFGKPISPRTEQDFWEYDFLAEKENSIRYEVRHNGQSYSLYVPNEFFGGLKYPDRLLVYIFSDASSEN